MPVSMTATFTPVPSSPSSTCDVGTGHRQRGREIRIDGLGCRNRRRQDRVDLLHAFDVQQRRGVRRGSIESPFQSVLKARRSVNATLADLASARNATFSAVFVARLPPAATGLPASSTNQRPVPSVSACPCGLCASADGTSATPTTSAESASQRNPRMRMLDYPSLNSRIATNDARTLTTDRT